MLGEAIFGSFFRWIVPFAIVTVGVFLIILICKMIFSKTARKEIGITVFIGRLILGILLEIACVWLFYNYSLIIVIITVIGLNLFIRSNLTT